MSSNQAIIKEVKMKLPDKNIATCIFLCNADATNQIFEQDLKEAVVLLKGSGDYINNLSEATRKRDRELISNLQTLNISKRIKSEKIAEVILKSLKQTKRFQADDQMFLQLCVSLNKLNVALQLGQLSRLVIHQKMTDNDLKCDEKETEQSLQEKRSTSSKGRRQADIDCKEILLSALRLKRFDFLRYMLREGISEPLLNEVLGEYLLEIKREAFQVNEQTGQEKRNTVFTALDKTLTTFALKSKVKPSKEEDSESAAQETLISLSREEDNELLDIICKVTNLNTSEEVRFYLRELGKTETEEKSKEKNLKSIIKENDFKKSAEKLDKENDFKKSAEELDKEGSRETDKYKIEESFGDKQLAMHFIVSLMFHQLELSTIIWSKVKSSTGAALFAFGLLKAIRKESTSEEHRETLLKSMNIYREYSIGTLDRTYKQDPDNTIYLLGCEMTLWGYINCIQLALKHGNITFLSHPACKLLNERTWYTGTRKNEEENKIKEIGGIEETKKFANRATETDKLSTNGAIQSNETFNNGSNLTKKPVSNVRKESSKLLNNGATLTEERKATNKMNEIQKPKDPNETTKPSVSVESQANGNFIKVGTKEKNFKVNTETKANTRDAFAEMKRNITTDPSDKVDTSSKENEARKDKLREWFSPSVIFMFRYSSFFVFLFIYAIFLICVLEVEQFHWSEWLLLLWVASMAAEQINQILRNEINLIRGPVDLNVFAWLEGFAILLFLLAWLLRLFAYLNPSSSNMMNWARAAFSVDFMAFTVSALELCYTIKFLGPLLLMIIRMLKTLLQFIIIVMVICFAYSVASESVLYPQSRLSPHLIFFVMRKAFWAMFGEFNLDELEDQGTSCTNDPDVYNNFVLDRCPTKAGRYYVPPLLGIYHIIVNILLFNLLIAILNYKIEPVALKSKEIWQHQTVQLTIKYSRVIFLPPPFTLLAPLLWWCRTKESYAPFPQIPDKTKREELQRLEVEKQFAYLQSQNVHNTPLTVKCNGYIYCPHKEKSTWLPIHGSVATTEVSAKAMGFPSCIDGILNRHRRPQTSRRYFATRVNYRHGIQWRVVGIKKSNR
ncbi:transient receptor potential cation channel subfamily M member 1-like isoform X1, partial [Biomphalaria pfeifferi]